MSEYAFFFRLAGGDRIYWQFALTISSAIHDLFLTGREAGGAGGGGGGHGERERAQS